MKLRSKILMMCLGCTLLALIIQTVLFQATSSQIIYNQSRAETEHALSNMQNEINTFVKNIESGLIDIYNDTEFMEGLKSNKTAAELSEQFYREAYTVGNTRFTTDDWVVSLYLYTPDHEIISTYRRAVTPRHNYPVDIYSDMEKYNSALVKEYVESDESKMLISSYYNQYREKDIVRFVMKLYGNNNYHQEIGYAVCDVDSKAISTIMKKYSADDSLFIWLQPSGDRAVLSIGNLSQENQEAYEQLTQEIAQNSGNEDIQEVLQDSGAELFCQSLSRYDLTAYSLMSQEYLRQNQNALRMNLLYIALIVVIIAIFLTSVISGSLTKPLDKLMDTIEKIKTGNTELRTNLQSKDEIGQLGRNFNEMLDQMEELSQKENQMNILRARAEYKALQAQINPHFLYNTLDTMASIAEVKNCREVSLLSQSLANIFRYSLNMRESFSSVAAEISHLKNYTFVMDVRMQKQVQYVYDVDDEVLQDKIPRLSLQPLVENALNHGLRDKRGEKKIQILAKIEEENLIICVADNGVGMDTEEINRKLQENDLEYIEKGDSIGLHNINARLKMLYGEPYGIHLESRIGEGTRVYMVIPRRREMEGEHEQ